MRVFSSLLFLLFLFVGIGCVGLKTSPYTYIGSWEEENFGLQSPFTNGKGFAKMTFYPDYRVEGFINDTLFRKQFMVSGSWRASMVNLLITNNQVQVIGNIMFSEDSSLVLVRYYSDSEMFRGIMKMTKKSIVDSLGK